MCRLFDMTSETLVSPMIALEAMDFMREGHDGSGVGLFLRDLGGPFEEIKDALILSGIFSEAGLRHLGSDGKFPDGLMPTLLFVGKRGRSPDLPLFRGLICRADVVIDHRAFWLAVNQFRAT